MTRARHRRASGVAARGWIRAGIKTYAALAAGALGASCLLAASGSALGTHLAAASAYVNGIDVASFQHPNGAAINWMEVAGAGYQFAAIKATEGNYYINPYYASDAASAVQAGMYVSAYEFANPADSTGIAAADYTVANAGNYTVGGQYLPLMLDLEKDPYSTDQCYGLSPTQMVSWISDYITEATSLTGAAPVIYTAPNWWNACTGNSTAFSGDVLWLASYSATPPSPLPGGWSNWGFWQYTSSGSVPGISGNVDLDYFSGAPEVDRTPAITTSAKQTTFDAGAPASFTFTATGFPAPTFSETGALPSGVTLSSDGVLSGTPAGDTAGTYPIQVTASNLGGGVTQAFTLTIAGRSSFVPAGPVRMLDTRIGTGGTSGPVGPNTSISLQVAGVDGVPATGVTAVVLNVTATNPTASGYVTVYPDGQARPTASNLNFTAGETIPNLVTVPVGSDGAVDFYNFAGSTNLVADLAGYYTTSGGGSAFAAAGPSRVLDTRVGTGVPAGAVGPNTSISLQVEGVDGVPATGVTAVALNVTAVTPTASGYVTVYPDGTTRPLASNLNFTTGEVIPNLVIVPVGSDGHVDFYNFTGSVHLVADLAGYYTSGTGSAFFSTGPARMLDTRAGTGGYTTPVGPDTSISLKVAGVDGVPTSGVSAVVLNVTATDPTASSYVTVYPDGGTRPLASNLNFTAGETIPNLVVVPVGSGGKIDLYNLAGSTDLVADLAGYYLS